MNEINFKLVRSTLEQQHGIISDKLFLEIQKETENDIRENILRFGKTPDAAYLVKIADTYLRMVKRLNLN